MILNKYAYAIRQACLAEQAYLCAYCCRQVGLKDHDCMNEHILPRHHHPQFSFDFNNIVASCTTKGVVMMQRKSRNRH
jgi:uncharacterized protein (TIGR02646 family)